jgi:3-methylcrotonyl-CoA carboxylase alpha subunit
MFAKLPIANRGEIACRILRTARRPAATVSSTPTPTATPARLWLTRRTACPPAPAELPKIDTLIEIAAKAGPGRFILATAFAENAAFAEACEAVMSFVAPAAIRAMGLKSEARRLMAAASVPLVPGFHDPAQNPQRLRQAAAELGFPILIKASAGGGGKGMRVAHSAAEFDRALESCRREAKTAFGDDAVLVEKFLPGVRHIEVQIFADGAVTPCTFERDCSCSAAARRSSRSHRRRSRRVAAETGGDGPGWPGPPVTSAPAPSNSCWRRAVPSTQRDEHPAAGGAR